MKRFLTICAFLFAGSSFAALPPYWASVNQIEMVMGVLVNFSNSIEKIEKVDRLTYRVETADCSAIVRLSIDIPTHDDGMPIPGPAGYKLEEVTYESCD